jgi:feruloyl esterase
VPDGIVATQKADGKVVRTRPLYAYPAFARYAGNGDPDLATNWTRAAPARPSDDIIDWAWGPKP